MTSYCPLFEPGLVDIERSSLEENFVEPFNDSERRKELLKGLKSFLEKFDQFQIEYEAWINGSFATKKEKPEDIDVVIFFNQEELNSLNDQQQKKFEEVILNADSSALKAKYNCEIFFNPKNDKEFRNYWLGMFGYTRSEDPKGIPRLLVNNSE